MTKILIVDDEPLTVQQVRDLITGFGYNSKFALKPGYLFPLLEQEGFDLILLDINMPETDGITLLRQLKMHPEYQDIPVIMLTGMADDQLLADCLECGAADFINKPIRAIVLKARIRAALTKQGYIRKIEQQKEILEQQTEELKTYRKHLEDLVRERTAKLREEIDEHRRTEESLQNAYKELQNTQAQLVQSAKLASIGELASGMAHELNQPLTVIRMTAQITRRILLKNESDSDKLRKEIEMIEKNTGRMMNIINHLRIFSRQSQQELSPVNINEVIENCFLMIGEQLRLHSIEIRKKLNPDIPKITADANQLEQVFLNLLTNAKDAIEEKRTRSEPLSQNTERIEIITGVSEDRRSLEILFKDMGTGVSSENADRIFDPFFTTKAAGKGTGLGLSISHGIVTNHKGKIELAETGPAGTTFRIILPLEES
ncbi:response regulator [Desulfobacterales bacterium HSG2]|nr:response regulator [Desulfobacterales bacterium HSG2]